ncbi:hypothetical protein ACNKHQ_16580 [Shigella flexneri]
MPLDRFVDAMIAIRAEIDQRESGQVNTGITRWLTLRTFRSELVASEPSLFPPIPSSRRCMANESRQR